MSGRFDQVPLINKNEDKDYFPRNSLHDPGEDVHDVFIREHMWRRHRCCRMMGLAAAVLLVLFAAGTIAYYFLFLRLDTNDIPGDQHTPVTGTSTTNTEEIIVKVTNNFSSDDTEKIASVHETQWKESDMQETLASGKEDSKEYNGDYEELSEESSSEFEEVKELVVTEGISEDDESGIEKVVTVEISEKYSAERVVNVVVTEADTDEEAGNGYESKEMEDGKFMNSDNDRSHGGKFDWTGTNDEEINHGGAPGLRGGDENIEIQSSEGTIDKEKNDKFDWTGTSYAVDMDDSDGLDDRDENHETLSEEEIEDYQEFGETGTNNGDVKGAAGLYEGDETEISEDIDNKESAGGNKYQDSEDHIPPGYLDNKDIVSSSNTDNSYRTESRDYKESADGYKYKDPKDRVPPAYEDNKDIIPSSNTDGSYRTESRNYNVKENAEKFPHESVDVSLQHAGIGENGYKTEEDKDLGELSSWTRVFYEEDEDEDEEVRKRAKRTLISLKKKL